ncbi:MAG: Hydroxyacylglutathione hydrolase [Chroococcopsis gigantea SAG 12.99]|jgi:cyclase|nr:Hydroxyacylglutathione hydrolase [Chroococcopsis gigantea SAG 12.99]
MKSKKQKIISIFLASCFSIALLILGWQYQTVAQGQPGLASAGLSLEKVKDGVYALISSTDFPPKDMKKIAICNGGIVISDKGVLVIDPFQSKELGGLLLSTVATLTDQPVRYVVNTHYHFDHTGGNPAIPVETPIIGRGQIKEFMLQKNRQLDPNPQTPRIIVNGETNLWLGDRKIILQEVEGHSGGTDLILYVPDADVVFAGDILFNQRIPYVSDGNIKQWQNSLDKLITNYASAKMVPGHGPITDISGVKSLKAYFADLEKLALSWKQEGISKEVALKNNANIPSAYQDYKFQAMYPGNLETAYQQITLGK